MVGPRRFLSLIVVVVSVVLLIWLYMLETPGQCAAPPSAERGNRLLDDGGVGLALVKRVLRDTDSLQYEATQVTIYWSQTGTKASIAKVVRKGETKTRIEFLPSAAAPYQLVICDGHTIWSYSPSRRVVVVQKFLSGASNVQFPGEALPRPSIDLLSRNYEIRLLGRAVIAAREAYSVLLAPRHDGAPIRKIWLDIEKPVILRVEEYNTGGELTFLTYYSQIRFPADIPDSVFHFAPPSGVRVISEPEPPALAPANVLRKDFGDDVVFPSFSSEGYVLEGGAISRLGSVECLHLQYTDGINTVSLFQTLGPPGIRLQLKDARTVRVNGLESDLVERPRANILRWQAGGRNLFLVGNVEEEIMIRMAESVQVVKREEEPRNSLESLTDRFLFIFFKH